MGRLRDLSVKLNKITEDIITNGILKIIQKDQSYAIDLNTNQLFAGKDSAGESLMHYRSESYSEYKLYLNPAGVTDLKLTGSFYRAWFMDASKFPIIFGSKDSKTLELTQKYGEDIFGLTKENISNLNQDIVQEVQDFYKELVLL